MDQTLANKAEWRAKSTHIHFTYKKIIPIPIQINQQIIPYANTAKYLGMILDAKLKWKEHVLIKKNKN